MTARPAPTDRQGPRSSGRPGWNPDAPPGAWDDDQDDPGGPYPEPLTRDEARALLARSRAVSPWFVLAVQAGIGSCVALLAALLTGRPEFGWSALYGTAVTVVPGALMARGMTSRLSSLTPAVSAVSVLAWELAKIAVSLVMLVLAPRLVQPLSWPVMLVAMALCLQVYWFALRWRGR